MKVDNAEYGLLTAITIFSARKNLCDPHRVEKIQEIYVDALQAYMQVSRQGNGSDCQTNFIGSFF